MHSQPDPIQIYRAMLLARMMDERMQQFVRQGGGAFCGALIRA